MRECDICTFLPTLVNGGATNAYASNGAYIALCFGDPGAWVFAVAVLLYPYIKHIVKKDYRFALGESAAAQEYELESAAECESATDSNSATAVPESENTDTTENGTTECDSRAADSTENELESATDNDSVK